MTEKRRKGKRRKFTKFERGVGKEKDIILLQTAHIAPFTLSFVIASFRSKYDDNRLSKAVLHPRRRVFSNLPALSLLWSDFATVENLPSASSVKEDCRVGSLLQKTSNLRQ
jgi:hypothetical protein